MTIFFRHGVVWDNVSGGSVKYDSARATRCYALSAAATCVLYVLSITSIPSNPIRQLVLGIIVSLLILAAVGHEYCSTLLKYTVHSSSVSPLFGARRPWVPYRRLTVL